MASKATELGPVGVVTGGGSGIGAATATVLAEAGWRVVVAGRREAPLRRVADAVGGLAVVADAATEPGANLVVEATVECFGRVDGLVANAGIVRPGSIESATIADWDDTIRTNLTGPFLLARAGIAHLRAARGAMVLVGSVGGLRAGPENVAYAASKAGVSMLAQALAVDHGPEGVRVNAVAPGWIASEMADAEMAAFGTPRGLTTEQSYAAVTRTVPARRAGTAREAAEAIAWLLSDRASYVNGATLRVDGGTAVVDAGTAAYLTPSAGAPV